MYEYLWFLCRITFFIDKFKRDIVQTFFNESETAEANFYYTPMYSSVWQFLQNVTNMSDILGIETLQANREDILIALKWLRTFEHTNSKDVFLANLKNLKGYFQEVEKEVRKKVSLLEEDECLRFTEALNCYIEELNYSAVVMSVSAVESRLYYLMVSKNPNEERKLNRLTLGELIREYLSNTQKYGGVVLKKHLPLLKYCNVYRIFSVHPKKEKITRANATAIMSMTSSFLFDKEQKARMQKE